MLKGKAEKNDWMLKLGVISFIHLTFIYLSNFPHGEHLIFKSSDNFMIWIPSKPETITLKN